MVIALRSACACIGRSTAQKIAFLFGSDKSFFPPGNGDAALRGAASGLRVRGCYPNSSFSTRARRYPALRIWCSISGKASFRKSCPRRWPGFAHSNCASHTTALSWSQSRGVPAATACLSAFGRRSSSPAHSLTDQMRVVVMISLSQTLWMGEFVRLVVLVLEQHVVFHVVRRVLDVRRAVHVACQVDDVLEVDLHGRVGEAAVVLQVLDGLLQSVDGVAARCEHRILVTQFGVDRRGVPVVGELVFGGCGGIRPSIWRSRRSSGLRGTSRCASWLFFRQVALGDLGDGLVPLASPSQDTSRVEQTGEEQQQQ